MIANTASQLALFAPLQRDPAARDKYARGACDAMDAIGACMQLLDLPTGDLRWGFVPDPYVAAEAFQHDRAFHRVAVGRSRRHPGTAALWPCVVSLTAGVGGVSRELYCRGVQVQRTVLHRF